MLFFRPFHTASPSPSSRVRRVVSERCLPSSPRVRCRRLVQPVLALLSQWLSHVSPLPDVCSKPTRCSCLAGCSSPRPNQRTPAGVRRFRQTLLSPPSWRKAGMTSRSSRTSGARRGKMTRWRSSTTTDDRLHCCGGYSKVSAEMEARTLRAT